MLRTTDFHFFSSCFAEFILHETKQSAAPQNISGSGRTPLKKANSIVISYLDFVNM